MRWLPVLLIGLLTVSYAVAYDAAEAPSKEQTEAAAKKLGDSDPAVREKAAATLRSAGSAADASLQNIVNGGDPEAARRARALLRQIGQSNPVDPPEVEPPEMNTYRGADHESKMQWVIRGNYRPGVISRLWAEEEDAELRAAMYRAMLQAPGPCASALVAQGNVPAAERLLDTALAQGNVQTAASYATLCYVRGNLDEAIARWSSRAKAPPAGENAVEEKAANEAVAASVLARLHRAAGNSAAAVAAARRSGDPMLVEEMLLDAHDWKSLAEVVAARDVPLTRPKQLGFLAGAYHLAGDDTAVSGVIDRMRKLANPDTIDDVAHTLLLCGRTDEGMRTLAESNDTIQQFHILGARQQWDDAFKLVDAKDAVRDESALSLRITAADQLYSFGEEARASALRARVAEENKKLESLEVYTLLGESYRRADEKDKAWNIFLTAFQLEAKRAGAGNAGAGDFNGRGSSRVAWRAFSSDDDNDGETEVAGGELWAFLENRFPNEPLEKRFDRARAIVQRTMPIAELKKMVDFTGVALGANTAAARHRVYSSHLMRAVAQRIHDAGQDAEAEQFIESAAEVPVPDFASELFIRLGDWSADRGDWAKAANAYARAWNVDRLRPVPLYLRAWALSRAGFHVRGGELTNLAYLLPLGDAWKRYEVLTMSLQRRLAPEVQPREASIILHTVRTDSPPGDLAQRLSARDALRKQDSLAAADWTERSMINYMGIYDLADPVRFLHIPQTIRRERAKGFLAKGDVESAEREIAQARQILPGEITLAIDVVPEFDRLGNKPRADELYNEAKRTTDGVLAKYPNSANDHNNAAWLAVNCARDAEGAMAHAKRAVELRPKNTAYLDTLAEVQFRQGAIDEAKKTMKQCAELEPHSPRHREQIERFEAAKRGEKRPLPLE